MRLDRPLRLKKDETIETEDRSRPVEPTTEPRLMLNNCQRCGRYRYVNCLSGGPYAYLCGRCTRELREERKAG